MTHRKNSWRVALTALLCAVQAPVLAAEPLIESFRLKNGMEVVVIPNNIVPAVTHMVWYRVGASDDPQGASGLAHFAEHIMFKGTDSVPPGEFSKRIARVGGTDNAFTSNDYTAYYQKVAKSYLPMVMEMEADRMQHLKLNPEEIRKEREVIIEERHSRVENDVSGYMHEQMHSALFAHHPYGIPTIGWEHEMKTLDAPALSSLIARAYHPANAFVVVSGDVTVPEVRALAEKYYGKIPANKPLERRWTAEPPQHAERLLKLTHPLAKQPVWARSYLAPSYRTEGKENAYALEVLSYLLGAEKIGLMYDDLIETKRLATAVSVSYNPNSRGPATFSIAIQPTPNASLDVIGEAVQYQLVQLVHEPVKAEVLEQAKQALTAWRTYQQEGLQSMAFTLGSILAVGGSIKDYREEDERILAVTAEDVQRAAAAVFQANQSVTAILRPEEK